MKKIKIGLVFILLINLQSCDYFLGFNDTYNIQKGLYVLKILGATHFTKKTSKI